MAQFGAFDRYGKPIQSPDNPAFTGTPPAAPVLRDLPTPAPERLFSPGDMPQLPSVQPQRAGLLKRAADFVLPPAGAATLDQPGMGRRPYVGDGSNYPVPAATAAPDQPAGIGGGVPSQPYDRAALYSASMGAARAGQRQAPMFPEAYDPAVMRRQLGGAIRDRRAADNARRAAGFDEEAALASAAGDDAAAASAQGKAIALRPHRYPTAPTLAEPWGAPPNSQAAADSDSESYIGAPSLPQPGIRHYPTAPLAGSKSAGAAPELQPGQASTADYVPAYQMGPGGALTLAMGGGHSAEFTPGPGANKLGVRVAELAGQRLGDGFYETDARRMERRPDLYQNGKPLLAGPFGYAVDPGAADALRSSQELTAALQASNPRGGAPRIVGAEPQAPSLPYGHPGDRAKRRDMLEAAQLADNRAARGALLQQQAGAQADRLAMDSAQLRQQGALAQAQDNTTRRGQDMQLLGREKRSPVSVKTADGGEVLFDPGSGQWLQPPGAQGGGLGKQDADRLKGITGHIGKAMGMDSAANPIDAATGAAYTAASRIGGGAYMATRGVRQFAGYTDADFAGIGQDVAAGRATIRTGKDGMAYAIYHGEDGKAYGVPIGPAANYANFQPAAGQPAAAR